MIGLLTNYIFINMERTALLRVVAPCILETIPFFDET